MTRRKQENFSPYTPENECLALLGDNAPGLSLCGTFISGVSTGFSKRFTSSSRNNG